MHANGRSETFPFEPRRTCRKQTHLHATNDKQYFFYRENAWVFNEAFFYYFNGTTAVTFFIVKNIIVYLWRGIIYRRERSLRLKRRFLCSKRNQTMPRKMKREIVKLN